MSDTNCTFLLFGAPYEKWYRDIMLLDFYKYFYILYPNAATY